MGSKVWVVGLDGSNVGYQALRLATMLMDPIEDKIEVLHICLPDDDIELATRLARNAEIELRRGHVHPLRFKICNDTLREPRSCQEHERRIGTLTCTPHALRHCGTAAAAAAAAATAAADSRHLAPPTAAQGVIAHGLVLLLDPPCLLRLLLLLCSVALLLEPRLTASLEGAFVDFPR